MDKNWFWKFFMIVDSLEKAKEELIILLKSNY